MSKSDYYAEEKTLAAPKQPLAKRAGGVGGLTSGAGNCGGEKYYGRDLSNYDDKDIEGLLSNLNTDELEELNNDFDPDNSPLLPPTTNNNNTKHATALPTVSQTKRTKSRPGGCPFKREKLLQYLEEKAKSVKRTGRRTVHISLRGVKWQCQLSLDLDDDEEEEAEYEETAEGPKRTPAGQRTTK
ncbi:hypothetical protein niasHT_037462 [Heterodera trifolii]|uniref:Uncharacterized protein n=1 Tax=Heterodera trifolii TaxID=157864 RepID=A0ABD2ILN3_9BILA